MQSVVLEVRRWDQVVLVAVHHGNRTDTYALLGYAYIPIQRAKCGSVISMDHVLSAVPSSQERKGVTITVELLLQCGEDPETPALVSAPLSPSLSAVSMPRLPDRVLPKRNMTRLRSLARLQLKMQRDARQLQQANHDFLTVVPAVGSGRHAHRGSIERLRRHIEKKREAENALIKALQSTGMRRESILANAAALAASEGGGGGDAVDVARASPAAGTGYDRT